MRPLFLRQVRPTDLSLWEHVRVLRNACALFMTGFQGEITEEMQEKFRHEFDPTNQQMWLAYPDEGLVPFGFLYLRRGENTWVPTYGLAEAWRDQGYGRELVRFSQNISGGTLELKVLRSNERAWHLYKDCGFLFTDSDDPTAFSMRWQA